MVEKEHDDRYTGREREHTGTVVRRLGGQNPELRALGRYTYRLVHAQESIRLLDLRFDLAALEKVEDITDVLADVARGILSAAIVGEIDILRQVRYKDS